MVYLAHEKYLIGMIHYKTEYILFDKNQNNLGTCLHYVSHGFLLKLISFRKCSMSTLVIYDVKAMGYLSIAKCRQLDNQLR